MTRFVLDSALLAQLPDLSHQVEFCNKSGERLGVFVPAAEWERMMYAWAQAEFTDEEIEKTRSEPGGRPLTEIVKGLPKE